MLAIALVAVAASAVVALLLCMSGHPWLALVAAPLVGSLSGLATALTLALVAPPGAAIRPEAAEIRARIGAGLRNMYCGIVQEPLPDRLARIAARLEKA